jgi:hypothetical protein
MNCSANDIYMYVGLSIAIMFTGIVIWHLMRKTREGLDTQSDDKKTKTIQEIVDKVKKENEILEDTLLIDKHRSEYEDMFLALEDYSNLVLIQMLSMFANNPSLENETAKTMIEGINQVNTLKSTMNDVMEFMDRKNSSAGSKSIKSFFN